MNFFKINKKYMPKSNYILVTPAKNEEKNIRNLIKSIIKQKFRPSIWVIVNDGSTDNTKKIIKKYKEKFSFIYLISLPKSKRDLFLRYSKVCKIGFKKAMNIARDLKINYNMVALLDADMILHKKYFSFLIKKIKKDKKLGIASGMTYIRRKKSIELLRCRMDIPAGGHRIWRKKCFNEIKGFQITAAPDTVSTLKAKVRGWKTLRFNKVYAYQVRMTGSVDGLWNGNFNGGRSDYYINFPWKNFIFRTFLQLQNYPYYIGIAYFFGYLTQFISKTRKLDDPDLIKYFKNFYINDLQKRLPNIPIKHIFNIINKIF